MKFPPRTSLPPIIQMKARFVHFEPLDHCATRVFLSSSAYQVVYKHKRDAQAAYGFITQNSLLQFSIQLRVSLLIEKRN